MNVQGLVVEEKQKKAEEDNPIKRHETLEQKRKEMGEGALESKEAEKVKGKADPSFKLASDIKATTNIKHVTDEVMGMCATTLQDLDGGPINATNVKTIDDDGIHEGDMSDYTRDHWVRATMEAPTKIGEQQIPCIALIDHGLEINMMSSKCYAQGRWPIDKNHGWKIRVAIETTEDLFRPYPSVKVTMGDVSMDKKFFVQDKSTYSVILGQPYINVVQMETNVIDDVLAFARIRSHDGRKTLQFLTVRPNHERNKECFREHPVRKGNEEFFQDYG